MDEKKPIFDRQDVTLTNHLRELTLEKIYKSESSQIVVLERSGTYPNWNVGLTVLGIKGKKALPMAKIALPQDTIFYAFLPTDSEVSPLVLLRPKVLEVWFAQDAAWEKVQTKVMKLEDGIDISQPGSAQPMTLMTAANHSIFYVPVVDGVLSYEIQNREVRQVAKYAVPPRAYHFSSKESLPLEIPFWWRSSFWYPQIIPGTLDSAAKDKTLFFPWMDEVQMVPVESGAKVKNFYFEKLSEAEREDGQTHVVMRALDLNQDGRTDFLLNKFKGAAASLTAETTIHLTTSAGQIEKKGLKIEPEGNRAAGAIPIDLNLDGKMELAVASSQFDAWAIAKALLQRQVKVTFGFYFFHGDGYRFKQPDFTRDISFGFDLSDLDIEGILPTLEGDFNGDRYPDVLYAKNRRALTVLIQKPNQKDLFAAAPSGEYAVAVKRKFRLGDLNGDGKSDVVMYDRKSQSNQKITVLINSGALK